MRYPLLGLEAALADPGCDRVELHPASGDAVRAFLRAGEDTWAPDDPESDPLHARELLELIVGDFGEGCHRLVCVVGAEKVVYAIERGAVRIRREALAAAGAGTPSDAVDLTPVAEALGIPRSRRKAKLEQARQFARIVGAALAHEAPGELRLLDLACGRSYLGFVLVHLLRARGRAVRLHGVDSDAALVEKSRQIAATLGWADSTFEQADLARYHVAEQSHDVVVSLHGCDTLTDEAIRIAWEARSRLVFVAPCCQHELRHQWTAHPLRWIARYRLLEQRLADVLTDGFRCLVLEALGYQVKTLRFTAPDVTPKNLLIQARLTSGPRPARARDAAAFLKQFGVRPTLARLLGMGSDLD